MIRSVGAVGLRAVGLPAEAAYALQGTENGLQSVAGAGTTIADAAAITSSLVSITTSAASSGVQLPGAPLGTSILVTNISGQTVNVWPDIAANAIFATTASSGTAAAAYSSLTNGKTAMFTKVGTGTTAWRATLLD